MGLRAVRVKIEPEQDDQWVVVVHGKNKDGAEVSVEFYKGTEEQADFVRARFDSLFTVVNHIDPPD